MQLYDPTKMMFQELLIVCMEILSFVDWEAERGEGLAEHVKQLIRNDVRIIGENLEGALKTQQGKSDGGNDCLHCLLFIFIL